VIYVLDDNREAKKQKTKKKIKKNKTTEIIYNLIKHDCFSVDSLRKHKTKVRVTQAPLNTGVNPGAPIGKDVPAPLVAPVVLI
jgi:hypothetical protein